jgi:hypothetical protein
VSARPVEHLTCPEIVLHAELESGPSEDGHEASEIYERARASLSWWVVWYSHMIGGLRGVPKPRSEATYYFFFKPTRAF